MAEFFKDALEQIPLFVSNFSEVLVHPRTFVKGVFSDATSKTIKSTKINEALIFLGICLLITATLKAAVFGGGGTEDATPTGHAEVNALYLAKDALWKAFIVMALAGVMRLAWRIVGGAATYERYLVVNCYIFGVLSVMSHIILLVGTFEFGHLQRWPALTFVRFFALALTPLFVWCLYCWRVYRDINLSTSVKSALAFLILLLISLPVLGFSYGLRFALIGHVYRDVL